MVKKLGSAARFGARYGKRLKTKILKVEQVQRKKQKCPFCGRKAVKRISTGIWHCTKCEAKFAGRAYKLTE